MHPASALLAGAGIGCFCRQGPLLHGAAPAAFLGGTAAFLGEVLELYCPEEHEEDMGNEKNGESLGENQGPENPDARVESLLSRRALLRAT